MVTDQYLTRPRGARFTLLRMGRTALYIGELATRGSTTRKAPRLYESAGSRLPAR